MRNYSTHVTGPVYRQLGPARTPQPPAMDAQLFHVPDLRYVHWMFSNAALGLPGYAPYQRLAISQVADLEQAFNPGPLVPTKLRRARGDKEH